MEAKTREAKKKTEQEKKPKEKKVVVKQLKTEEVLDIDKIRANAKSNNKC